MHQTSNISQTDLIYNIAQKINYFSVKNSTKLCAEGAIGNLMNVLHCNEIEVNQFWSIVQSPIHLIQTTLGESLVPKAVLKKSGGKCDSI